MTNEGGSSTEPLATEATSDPHTGANPWDRFCLSMEDDLHSDSYTRNLVGFFKRVFVKAFVSGTLASLISSVCFTLGYLTGLNFLGTADGFVSVLIPLWGGFYFRMDTDWLPSADGVSA